MGKLIKNNAPATIAARRWQDVVERIIVSIISVLVFLAFGFVALMSIFQTSEIDPNAYINEHILYQGDNVLLNLMLMAIIFAVIFLCRRYYDFFARVNMRVMEIALVLYVLILGLIWVLNVQCVPAADSANVFEAATGAAQDNYTGLTSNALFYNHDYYGNNSYFLFYPFQLGFVFICEMIYRVFGVSTAIPLEVINVICLSLAYLGIAKITKLLFERKAIEFIAIVMMIGCLQPILFTPFPYGNIMGMSLAIWASYFLIRYMKSDRWLMLIPSGILLVFATLAKYNNMIYLVAFGIVLLIHAIKEKKWQSIAFILIASVCVVGASKLVILSYENRSGEQYGSGVSQTLYLDVGLQESYMAPGWYTDIGMRTFMNNGFDTNAANAAAKMDIQNRLDALSADTSKGYDFFSKKILSQWNETTYESVWVSKVKRHYNTDTPTGIVSDIYDSDLGKFLGGYFDLYMQMLFFLFAYGIIALMIRKKTDICKILLPLILYGAFLYHLLFEGKSQYILTYIILLIPFAAWGALDLMDSKVNFIPVRKNRKTYGKKKKV